VKAEDPLISLESDKATMDVPSPAAGTVKDLKVKVGDRVSQGKVILVLDAAAAADGNGATAPSGAPAGGNGASAGGSGGTRATTGHESCRARTVRAGRPTGRSAGCSAPAPALSCADRERERFK